MINWQEIQVSQNWCEFLHRGKPILGPFKSVLKFHAPGLAPAQDEAGWFIIDVEGNELTQQRFKKVWGYYDGLCAVEDVSGCYHILANGSPAYSGRFHQCGNFQENRCAVQDGSGSYFHIGPNGKALYTNRYRYAGDYKDGIACVMLQNGNSQHIGAQGQSLYSQSFLDIGIYHKAIATARDQAGWFHIDLKGEQLYTNRFKILEPFYNGKAFGEDLEGKKVLVDLSGSLDFV